MSKRSKMVVLGVILLAFVAVATKPLWSEGDKGNVEVPSVGTSQTEPSQVPTNQLESPNVVNATAPKLAQLLDDSFAKGQPVAVVYTYNADCWPSTKEFFSNHRSVVQQIEKQYSDKVTFTWIDIAIYQVEENEQLMKMAEEMKVQTAPALVLMDSERKVLHTWQGDVNQDNVSKAIEQVVK